VLPGCRSSLSGVAEQAWPERANGSIRAALPEGEHRDLSEDLTLSGYPVHVEMVGRRIETDDGRVFLGTFTISVMSVDVVLPPVDAEQLALEEQSLRRGAAKRGHSIVRFTPMHVVANLPGAEVEWTQPAEFGSIRGLMRCTSGARTIYCASMASWSFEKTRRVWRANRDIANRFFQSIGINDHPAQTTPPDAPIAKIAVGEIFGAVPVTNAP
jgi:hypothetical protein